jgi:tetratricopeptide (TPR) repeat protein
MNDANHDLDSAQSVLEAATELEAEGSTKDSSASASEALVFGALDKLAQATDQISERLGEKIDAVQSGFDHDLKKARERMAEAQEEALERIEESSRESAAAIEKVLEDASQRQDSRESGLRQTIAESLDNIVTQQERTLGKEVARVREDITQLNEKVDHVDARFDTLHEAISELRAEWQGAQEAQGEAREQALEQLRESILESQQKVVSILAEGMGHFEHGTTERFDSIDKNFEDNTANTAQQIEAMQSSLSDSLDASTAEHKERFDAFEKIFADAREVLDEERDHLREIAEEVKKQHASVAEQVELERQRGEDAERQRKIERARTLNNAGVARYHSGEFTRAREIFEQAIELDPNSAETFNNLGLTLTELDQHDEATVAFETAAELDPDLAASYNNLGYVLFRQENFEAAVEMYKEALGRTPDSSAAHTNLGNALQKLGRTEEAVEAWRKAVEIDPENVRAKRYLQRFTGSESGEQLGED